MEGMEKYGVPAESIICKTCRGSGQKRIGKKQYIPCPDCNGECRTKEVNPVKEAEEIKKQIEEKDE